MLKDIFDNKYVLIIFFIGVVLRLNMFYSSPPNNSYDDHLEVINIYATSHERPLPFDCWECYQPPAYYSIAAVMLNLSKSIGLSNIHSWKIVQFLNPLLSIIVLLFFYKILLLFDISIRKRIVYFSMMAILPRDIFTASMIGNDYLLVLSAIGSLYFFLKIVMKLNFKETYFYKDFIYLSIFTLLGALTKQHGVILLVFPGFIAVMSSFLRHKGVTHVLIIFSVIIAFSACEELWKYNKTGEFLVSNQHYYDYANNQYPGSIEKVEFGTFRIFSLFEYPFITEKTSKSLPTEIFARVFFDYEWRFISPRIPLSNTLGRIGYIVGLFWVFFIFWIIFKGGRRILNSILSLNNKFFMMSVPVAISILYFLVPLIQTIRYPYFSSMKAMFLLPGIIIFILMHAYLSKFIKLNRIVMSIFIIINITYGMLLVLFISVFHEVSLGHLYGPLWYIP